jgi:hypothetical protein
MAELASRQPLPRFVQRSRAETLVLLLPPALAPTGGTFTLLDADGEEVLSDAISVLAGVPFYGLLADYADDYELPQAPWRERWELTGVSGQPWTAGTIEHEVQLCRVAPVQHVDLEQLYKMHAQWRTWVPRSQPAHTPESALQLAWEEMIARCLGDNLLPNRVLNWWAFAVVHRYWAASFIASDFAADVADASRWERLADRYWDRSQSEYERMLRVTLDADEDGVADTGRSGARVTAGPSRRQWRWG